MEKYSTNVDVYEMHRATTTTKNPSNDGNVCEYKLIQMFTNLRFMPINIKHIIILEIIRI